MEIILGKTAGFCPGIIRAVTGAKNVLEKEGSTYCFGELLHNKQMLEQLGKEGLKVIHQLNGVEDNQIVIIRPHGISKDVYELAKKKKLKLVDLTCVKVIKVHDIAKEYSNKGYYIFLLGELGHPEVVGSYSFCGKDANIIEKKEDIKEGVLDFKKSKKMKLLILSQTTFHRNVYEQIVEDIKTQILGEKESEIEIKVIDTICNATKLRQEETIKISKQVDLMIIIGGKKSSNSQNLYKLAKEHCKNSICVQTKEDINLEEVLGYKRIGIMAGASTPDESTNGVIQYLKENQKDGIKV